MLYSAQRKAKLNMANLDVRCLGAASQLRRPPQSVRDSKLLACYIERGLIESNQILKHEPMCRNKSEKIHNAFYKGQIAKVRFSEDPEAKFYLYKTTLLLKVGDTVVVPVGSSSDLSDLRLAEVMELGDENMLDLTYPKVVKWIVNQVYVNDFMKHKAADADLMQKIKFTEKIQERKELLKDFDWKP